MAEHLRHEFAREGMLVRPATIVTLSKFIEPWVQDLAQVTPASLYLLVERAVQRERPREFAKVAGLPGFSAALARTIEEFSAAGCRAAQVPGAAGGIFREVERQLERRGLALRARRLERAAERIRAAGLGGVHGVSFEGFLSLTAPERKVVEAVGRHAHVTIGEPMSWNEADAEVPAAREIFRAPSPDRESDEIARRILKEVAGGRKFRECGVIVRNPEGMAGPLEAAFDRFGIPARFYFDSRVDEDPAVRYLAGLVEAALSRWDHEITLTALRQRGTSEALDRFDFEVRRRMPGRGLDALEALAAPGLRVQRLRMLDPWTALSLPAENWAATLKKLRGLVEPPPAEVLSRELSRIWRSTAGALSAFEAALDETARFLADDGPLPLERFWKSAAAVLRLTPMRAMDARRDVVHVLSVYEARQWELPVVFVCGLTEGQFPKHHPQNAFFSDEARRDLQRAGVPVRTTAELELEERRLFDFACTRATEKLVLSYAETDARGNAALLSSFLEEEGTPAEIWTRPAPRRAAGREEVRIADPGLLPVLATRHATLSPSGLESFLKCPFQFFAGRTLHLKQRPELPRERLDFLVRGMIVHEVLAQAGGAEELERVFDRVFHGFLEDRFIPDGYAAEACRQELLADLRNFFEQQQLPNSQERRVEQKFELTLSHDVRVRGRIDRVDRLTDGSALVIDYKYSPAKRVSESARSEEALQGPLYVLAAEGLLGWPVKTMYFVALKKFLRFVEMPVTAEWTEAGRAKTLEAATRIRGGEIAPSPSDPAHCEWCDYRDVCRYRRVVQADAEDSE